MLKHDSQIHIPPGHAGQCVTTFDRTFLKFGSSSFFMHHTQNPRTRTRLTFKRARNEKYNKKDGTKKKITKILNLN